MSRSIPAGPAHLRLLPRLTLSAAATLALTLPLNAPPACASPTDSTARILFQSFKPGGGGDTLYTMRPDGTDVRQLALGLRGSAISPDWSPDGREVVFVVPDDNDVQSLWTAEADGTNAHEVVPCLAGCLSLDYPAWSPDGRFLAFTHYDADPPPTTGPPSGDSIRTVDLRTGHEQVVAHSSLPVLLDVPRWSPDGKSLVVEADRIAPDGSGAGNGIATVRVADGRIRPVTDSSVFAFHPDWSARGNRIVFATYDLASATPPGGPANIATIRPDATHLRVLTKLPPDVQVGQPTFTPDGSRVTFTYQDQDGRHAAFVGAHGGRVRVVATAHPGPVTHPRLSTGRSGAAR